MTLKSIQLLLLVISAFAFAIPAQARHSLEEATRLTQNSNYNALTGFWSVKLTRPVEDAAKRLKKVMPHINYLLVNEKPSNGRNLTLIFRGEGDRKIIIKLKAKQEHTSFGIKTGILGNKNDANDLFVQIFTRM